MLAIWTVALCLLGAVKGLEICYGDGECYPTVPPWGDTPERPIAISVWSRERLNPRFLLYTRHNQENYQEINATNPCSIASSKFGTERKTRIIIHGYTQSGEELWIKTMCQSFFQVEDVNCIIVDWGSASWTVYPQAANLMRVLGAVVASFIDILSNKLSYPPCNVHLIGHSLGAQAAGEAGKKTPGLGRITALDPAQPYFEGTPDEVRLDKSDATLVDVIHTNCKPYSTELGLGIKQPCGHLDYFPNGGKEMPECELARKNLTESGGSPSQGRCLLNPIFGPLECSQNEQQQKAECPESINLFKTTFVHLKEFLYVLACDHFQSITYYIHSITNPEAFTSYPCENWEKYQAGECQTCPSEGCPKMGHYADTYEGVILPGQVLCLNTSLQSFSSK